jgi:hypothetical protein
VVQDLLSEAGGGHGVGWGGVVGDTTRCGLASRFLQA